MDNPETLATLDTRYRTKTSETKNAQHRKLKRWATWNPPKTGDNPGAREGYTVSGFSLADTQL